MKFSAVVLLILVGMYSCNHESTWEKRLLDKDAAFDKKLPEQRIHDEYPDSYPQLVIRLEKGDIITINDKKCSTENVNSQFALAHDELGTKTVIHIFIDNRATYGALMNIQGAIERYYFNVRTEESMKQFDLPYPDLDKKQKATIDTTYPARIVEHQTN